MTPADAPAILEGMTAAVNPYTPSPGPGFPPIMDAHRAAPDFSTMTESECRTYCRRVWAHYCRPGVPPVTARPDADEVLAILRAHTPPA